MNARFSLLIVACCTLAQTAAGDGVIDKRLRLSVQPRFGGIRGQAPLPLKVTLGWSDPQLLEGHLLLKWYVDQTHLGTYTAPEAALSNGSVTRNVLLPPVIMPYEDAVYSIQGEFITKNQIYDLDVHDVYVPLDWRRTFVVGIGREPPLQMQATASGAQSISVAQMTESFRLERFIDEPLRNRELSTMVVEVAPRDLPRNPLDFMGFDVLVIPAENFAELKSDCLTSLTTWVKAGGSLCVLVDSPVSKTLVTFLNQTIGEPGIGATYLQTEEDRLLPVEGEPLGIDQHRCELGRLIVARGNIDNDSEAWQRAMLFLWKIREDRIHQWEQGEPWSLLNDETNQYGFLEAVSFEPDRGFSVNDMTDLMLPQSIQGLPLVTVCTILAMFLMIIAPGDYYLLGWLKRRRWTWVLFPATSLLFTFLMIKLAESHLGSANLDRSITIIDLSSMGRPLKTSRIELKYPAFSHTVVDDQVHTMMVPVDPDTKMSNASRGKSRYLPDYEPPWDYVGLLPEQYSVQRNVRQWSPRMSRTTILGETPLIEETRLSGFAWQDLTWTQVSNEGQQQAIVERLHMLDPEVDVAFTTKRMSIGAQNSTNPRERAFAFAKFVSHFGDSKVFDIISRMSPNAAGHWDDLMLKDWSNDDVVVVAMTEPSEGHYVVYRKLLTKEN